MTHSRSHIVSILATNPAFTALLRSGLEEEGYRVPCFTDAGALATFMQIAPVDVVVLDSEAEAWAADDVAMGLRAHPRPAHPDPRIVVLTRAEPPFHGRFLNAGADLVLKKPVVPARLAVAIARLVEGEMSRSLPQAAGGTRAQGAMPRPTEGASNVIPLFGRRDRQR